MKLIIRNLIFTAQINFIFFYFGQNLINFAKKINLFIIFKLK